MKLFCYKWYSGAKPNYDWVLGGGRCPESFFLATADSHFTGQVEDFGAHCPDCPTPAQGGACSSRFT